MHRVFAVFAFCFIFSIPAIAGDLSIFDKKTPSSEVKTELYVQNFDQEDSAEEKVGEEIKRYGADGELAGKTYSQGTLVVESAYTHEFDKDGRVTKRTQEGTWTIGKGPTIPRLPHVWVYTYDGSGTTVVSKEPQTEGDESTPITETWKLDTSGKMLEYSKVFGEQSLKTVYERDKAGKLLVRTEMYCDKVINKETCSYRDDGTLKESEESTPEKDRVIKRQYNDRGEEANGEMLDKDGKVVYRWVVEKKTDSRLGGSTEEITIKLFEGSAEKLISKFRYVVTTALGH